MHECNQFTCVLQQTCMYYTFGCELKNRALDEKWKCHYKDACVICRLNKTCKQEKNKERKEVEIMKLIGFVEMQKKHGKILFVTEKGSGKVAGDTCDKIFLFEDVADKVNESHIGKNISVSYGCEESQEHSRNNRME